MPIQTQTPWDLVVAGGGQLLLAAGVNYDRSASMIGLGSCQAHRTETPRYMPNAATTATGTALTSMTIAIPANTVVGEMVCIFLRLSVGTTTPTWTTNAYTTVFDNTDDASNDRTLFVYRVIDGSENYNITPSQQITTGATSTKVSAVAMRIRGAINPAIQPPTASAVEVVGATITTINASAVTPGSTSDFLYLYCVAWDGASTPVENPPATGGWTAVANAGGSSGGALTNAQVQVALKSTVQTSSEDPGDWNIGTPSTGASAWVVAIYSPTLGAADYARSAACEGTATSSVACLLAATRSVLSTGSGALATTSTQTTGQNRPRSASLAAEGALIAAAVRGLRPSAILAGAGACSATRGHVAPRSADSRGEGALAVAAFWRRARAATLAGIGALDVAYVKSGANARFAATVGSGALATERITKAVRAATTAGTAACDASRRLGRAQAATLSGTSVLTAAIRRGYVRQATTAGFGALDTAYTKSGANARFAATIGSGALVAERSWKATRAATTIGTGAATADRRLGRARDATTAGTGALIAIARKGNGRQAAIAGTGALTAAYAKTGISPRSATTIGAGELAATRFWKRSLAATTAGSATLVASARRGVPRNVVSTGLGALASQPRLVARRSAATTGAGTLSALATATGFVNVDVLGVGTLTATAVHKLREPTHIVRMVAPVPILRFRARELPRTIVAREASGSLRRFYAKREAA